MCVDAFYTRIHIAGPLKRLIKAMSRGIRVTLFACMAHRLASDRRHTRYASAASCMHSMADFCHRYSAHWYFIATSSLTSRAKGAFLRSRCVERWNCLISWRARTPGLTFFGVRCFCLLPTPGGALGVAAAPVEAVRVPLFFRALARATLYSKTMMYYLKCTIDPNKWTKTNRCSRHCLASPLQIPAKNSVTTVTVSGKGR